MKFSELKKGADGLIPAVIQNYKTMDILMVGYMNEESFNKTLEENVVCFFSRSRQKLWKKGENSGNVLTVKEIYLDCDKDTILVKADPAGPVCHTGEYSCFFNKIEDKELKEIKTGETKHIFEEIYETIKGRDENPKEGSYTNYLLEKGIDKILKKVGEESAETIIAAKNRVKDEVVYETSDLIYHLSVMLYEQGVTWDDICEELRKRR